MSPELVTAQVSHIIFAVYPGVGEEAVSLVVGHHFVCVVVQGFCFLSLFGYCQKIEILFLIDGGLFGEGQTS